MSKESVITEFVSAYGMSALWFVLLIAFVVVEMITVGLTTIWLAGGAVAAFIAATAGLNVFIQIAVFLVVSFVLICFTRPFVKRFITPKRTRTNSEGLIDSIVRVTGEINNREGKGSALAGGQEWTARSYRDDVVIASEQMAKVVAIEGVKLIVEPLSDETK